MISHISPSVQNEWVLQKNLKGWDVKLVYAEVPVQRGWLLCFPNSTIPEHLCFSTESSQTYLSPVRQKVILIAGLKMEIKALSCLKNAIYFKGRFSTSSNNNRKGHLIYSASLHWENLRQKKFYPWRTNKKEKLHNMCLKEKWQIIPRFYCNFTP